MIFFLNSTLKEYHSSTPSAVEISLAEQRGSIGDAALPRFAKRYFTDSEADTIDAFRACGDYLRKLSRKGGDVFERRYCYVGSRHGVCIFELYNIQSQVPETTLYHRLIWQEHRNLDFIIKRRNFVRAQRELLD